MGNGKSNSTHNKVDIFKCKFDFNMKGTVDLAISPAWLDIDGFSIRWETFASNLP